MTEGPSDESNARFHALKGLTARMSFCCRIVLVYLMLCVHWLGCSDAVG